MSELATLFPCKRCGAQITPPVDLATTSVACAHCGTEQLVPDAPARLALVDKLAQRRAEATASRRFDAWLYVVIGVFVAGVLGYVGWIVVRSTRAAVDPAATESELASWAAAQHGCHVLAEPTPMNGRARIALAATGCVRAHAQTDSSVFSLTATLVDAAGRAVAGPTSGHVADVRTCVTSPQELTLVIDIDVLRYAVAAVDCPAAR